MFYDKRLFSAFGFFFFFLVSHLLDKGAQVALVQRLGQTAQPLAAVTRSPGAARADAAESHGLAWLPLEEAARKMGEPGALRALAKAARLLGIPLGA